jgi:hypothetical protein
VNPIVGHLTFLFYDWKREVNHPLIKTPQKKIQLIFYMYVQYIESVTSAILRMAVTI